MDKGGENNKIYKKYISRPYLTTNDYYTGVKYRRGGDVRPFGVTKLRKTKKQKK